MIERFRPIYDTSAEQQVRSGEVVLARELVDRQSIELHADLLINNRTRYKWEHLPGEDHHNAVTSLFEELTAAGDLSEIDFTGDQAEVHAATIARLLNGYNSAAPEWELKRRFAEICEELTVFAIFCKIQKGELPQNTVIVTTSDFPSDSGEELQKIHNMGYRASNKKGMLRQYSFIKDENGEWIRHLEQISHSNALTEDRTRNWFNQNASAVPLHATGALNEQIVTTTERLPDGVVTLIAEFDELGEEAMHYGEPVAEAAQNQRPSYWNVREKSKEARKKERHFIAELEECEALLTQQLHEGKISYAHKLHVFHEKQQEIIERMLMQEPKYATDARGVEAAKHYEAAHAASMAGDMYQANMHLNFAIQSRDRLSGGSCGGSGKEDNELNGIDPPDATAVDKILSKFESDKEAREETDQYGSLEAECPKCHETNKREKNDWIYKCKKCGDTKIACGRKKPKQKAARAVIKLADIFEGMFKKKEKPKVLQNA